MNEDVLNTLDHIEKAVAGSRWSRLRIRPLRYAFGVLLAYLVSRVFRKGIPVSRQTLFGFSLALRIPAHLDIYIFGCKTSLSDLALTRYLLHRVKPGMVVFDIGASAGFYTVLFAKLAGESGHVHAFDPGKLAFSLLVANVEICPNVTAHALACGRSEGMAAYFAFPVRYAEYNSMQPDDYLRQTRWYQRHTPDQTMVAVTSIDHFVAGQKRIPDIVKIDAENSEVEIVKGMSVTSETIRPEVIMRIWPRGRNCTTQVEAIQILSGRGYTVHGLARDGRLRPLEVPEGLADYPYEYLVARQDS